LFAAGIETILLAGKFIPLGLGAGCLPSVWSSNAKQCLGLAFIRARRQKQCQTDDNGAAQEIHTRLYHDPLQRPRHQMARARGQRSKAAINREFPHQVIVPAKSVGGRELARVIAFHDRVLVPVKSRSAFQNDQWYAIYCFAERERALAFRLAFGGTLIDRPLPHP